MTKLLRQTIEKIEKLPENEQDAAAGALLDYVEHTRAHTLTDEQAAEVRRRLADSNHTRVPLDKVRERFRSA